MINPYSIELLMKQRQNEVERAARNTWTFSAGIQTNRLDRKPFLPLIHKKQIQAIDCCPCC